MLTPFEIIHGMFWIGLCEGAVQDMGRNVACMGIRRKCCHGSGWAQVLGPYHFQHGIPLLLHVWHGTREDTVKAVGETLVTVELATLLSLRSRLAWLRLGAAL